VHKDTLLSGSNDSTIKAWSTCAWVCSRTFEGHERGVKCLLVYEDVLLSGVGAGMIKAWQG
jgi:WD40 repeat protein